MKPVLVSGIQPSGRLHIGNYLGALRNFVDLQDSAQYEYYFFIADLHSITEPFEPKEKKKQILETLAEYLAAGIDPKKSCIFQQSQVPTHAELGWILNTVAPMGDLERMTQYKDKSARQKENVNVGLFDYPVLMAADILMYDAAVVPVGDDQLQHLELTRTLARRFNARFGKTFTEPKALLTKSARVMSLTNPEKKMSKSEPAGCLFLDDAPAEIAKKIAHAVTDSGSAVTYEPHKKPGLANLLDIYTALSHMEPQMVAKEFAGENYATFKKRLVELAANHLAKFRARKKELLSEPATLVKILEEGSARAARVAEKKIKEVKRKIGIAL
ncbi:MAG: tryptophan--tRNA ligase [Minisyncoccia bacterium]|jgi:tryptophanyl-tRNA synthetase